MENLRFFIRIFMLSLAFLLFQFFYTKSYSQNCPTYSSVVTSAAVTCGDQPYYFQVANTGCNGTISFTVSGNYGSFASEITWEIKSNLTNAIVAQGGPGTNNGVINVTVGPLNPTVVGNYFTLTVNDSFGGGFS